MVLRKFKINRVCKGKIWNRVFTEVSKEFNLDTRQFIDEAIIRVVSPQVANCKRLVREGIRLKFKRTSK